jgi:hypothetical protein
VTGVVAKTQTRSASQPDSVKSLPSTPHDVITVPENPAAHVADVSHRVVIAPVELHAIVETS